MNLKNCTNEIVCEGTVPDTEISNVTDKLTDVRENSVFVCIAGKHTDGHTLAKEAVERGACAVVCERDIGMACQLITPDTRKAYAYLCAAQYGHPERELKIIGITGTNGKTTTAVWTRYLLEKAGHRCGIIGTLGTDTRDGTKETQYTTPGSDVFFRTLREMADAGCEYAVAEISSQALAQSRCAGIRYEAAVFTNLSEEHLDYHGSMEQYAREKAKLFADAAVSVLNARDSFTPVIRTACKGRIVTFADAGNADYTAKNIMCKGDRVTFVALSGMNISRVTVPMPGTFPVRNALAAIAVCTELGIPMEDSCAAMANVPPICGRMQRVIPEAPFAVYVDYAHTEAALKEVLLAMRQVCTGRIFAVFGCGGDRDRGKREKMGETASVFADYTFITDDNPRSEDPAEIRQQIALGFRGKQTLFSMVPHRRDAIRMALQRAKPGDGILIAGKGHETSSRIGEHAETFNDAAECETLWREMQQ